MDKAGLDDLLRRARRRDPDALRLLVEVYSPRVFGLLFRLSGSRDAAEELLQETFLRVVRAIDQYEHVGKFEPWLFRIAANLARDHARQATRRGSGAGLEADGYEPDALAKLSLRTARSEDPAATLAEHEAGQRLEECLKCLPQADREVILLRHYSELSFREIAKLLGVPLGTALARAHRALKRLRELMNEGNERREA